MRLGAIIDRIEYYRHLGPILAAAGQKGWAITCFHHDPVERRGKVYSLPAEHPVPQHLETAITVRPYADQHDLRDGLRTVDAVLGLQGPANYGLEGPPGSVKWFNVQHGVDLFQKGYEHLITADCNFMMSEYWLDFFGAFFANRALPGQEEAACRSLARKCHIVGAPQMDAVHFIDKEDVRERYGLPNDRPIVLYLPSSACAHQRRGPWCRDVFSASGRLQGAYRVLRRSRDAKFLRHAMKGYTHRAMVNAVRGFCDRNGAHLVMKSRRKTPYHDYELAAADQALYDENYFPPSYLELAAVCDLVLGGYSTTVYDTLYTGTPYVLLELPLPECELEGELTMALASGDFLDSDGIALWECDGAIRRLDIDATLNKLPRMDIGDFDFEEDRRKRYLETMLTHTDGKSSERLLAAIEDFTAGRVDAHPPETTLGATDKT